MKNLRFESGPLDPRDQMILGRLYENARTSMADLARLVGMSPPSVAERVKRLEDAGVITGYRVTISTEAIGRPINALLRVRPVPGEMKRVTEILKGIPEITQCDRVTGEDCFVARVSVRTMADLERVIDGIVPYAMTNTSIIQSSPVPERLPPLTTE